MTTTRTVLLLRLVAAADVRVEDVEDVRELWGDD
jgi:hypothetical protein